MKDSYFKKKKGHTKVENHEERLKIIEGIFIFLLYAVYWVSWIVGILTARLDFIKTMPIEYNWLQITGMALCMIVAVGSSIMLKIIREK